GGAARTETHAAEVATGAGPAGSASDTVAQAADRRAAGLARDAACSGSRCTAATAQLAKSEARAAGVVGAHRLAASGHGAQARRDHRERRKAGLTQSVLRSPFCVLRSNGEPRTENGERRTENGERHNQADSVCYDGRAGQLRVRSETESPCRSSRSAASFVAS